MNIPLSCRVGLGLVFLTFILVLLGVFHLYTPSVLMIVWLVWLAASPVGLFQVRREPFFTESFPHGDPSWNPLFLRICLGVTLLMYLIFTMTPETRHDPYDYHLTIPALYLAHQSIVEIPWHVFSYMPKNCEILYGLALGVGNDSLTKLFHFLFGCLSVLSVASFMKRTADHEASMLAGLLVVTLPVFGFLATLSYIDLGRAFWELSALYMLAHAWHETPDKTRRYSFLLSALFAGMALGTKYVSFLVFFPPYLLLAALTLWKRIVDRRLCLTLFGTLCILAPLSPWLIYNAVWTGNPVYPLLSSLFGMNIPPAQAAYDFIRGHAPQMETFTWPAFPGYILSRINGLLLDGNALFLIGLIALATTPWWRRQSIGRSLPAFARRGFVFYIVASTILFLAGSDNMDGRFFVSTLMLLAAPVVFFLYAVSSTIHQTSPWGRYVIPGFALVLFANSATYRFNQMKALDESPMPILTDSQRDQWLSRRFRYYEATQWANHNLPADATVLGMGYPLRLKFIAKIKYGYIPFLHDLNSETSLEDLAKRLYQNDVLYIVKPFITLDPPFDLSLLNPDYMKSIYSYRGIEIFKLRLPDRYESE
ncbi:MAG: glycosyltransferase family 39 protein [Candidatus Omnitrophica bacterium]|nr:glycosyltransferase family 39 protein [Candidatus Omnitrophota bacterium]